MKDNLPQRKSIRLKQYDYSSPGYYFITICIKNRLHLLGAITNLNLQLSKEGLAVNTYLSSIPETYDNVKLDEYIIMPNHIHMIIIINNPAVGRDERTSFVLGRPRPAIFSDIEFPRHHDIILT